MRRAALLALLVAGCGADDGPVASARMALGTAGGLGASSVGSVLVLVLGGAHASCAEALGPASPLDDPDLDVLRHALFTVDGTAKHLSIPAGRPLVFYAEAYASSDGTPPVVGHGCAEATVAAGASAPIAITLSGDP